MSGSPKTAPPPPPPFEVVQEQPTTLTMRALDGEPEDTADDADRTFAAAFDEAVRAYLFRDYSAALRFFEEALLHRPNEPRCLKNIALLKSRLDGGVG